MNKFSLISPIYNVKEIVFNKKTIQALIDKIRNKQSFAQQLFYKIEGLKHKGTIKTLILGSSHLANGYWAEDEEYNLSMPSQDLYYAYNLYKEFNNSNIKNIVIAFSVFTPGLSIIRTICSDFCIPYKVLLDIPYQDNEVAIKKQLYLKENKCKTEIEEYKKNFKIEYPCNGNLLRYPHKKFNKKKACDRALKHLKNNKRENSQMHYCVDIIELATKNNQNIFFVLPPTTKTYREVLPPKEIIFKELINVVQNYSNAKILNYFDTDYFDEVKDFTNEDHLNRQGAIKLASFVRKEINE